MSFIRAFLLLAIPALLACAAGTITYRNCTDRALCLSGCNEAVVPTDVCFATSGGQILSEIISCVPQIRVCGDLSYYTDAFCTQLAHTDGFVCDQCNPDSGNGGTFNEAVCSRHIDGHEYLALLVCGTDSTCGTCNNYQNVSVGECIPVAQSHADWKATIGRTAYGRNILSASSTPLWGKYTGAVTCNGVSMQQWTSNAQCNSTPARAPLVPENSCIDGASIHCNWL